MKICIVGTGYVGLVTGTCFAEMGNDVVCVDIDEEKIAELNKGNIPIYEPGLEELVERNLEQERLKFSTDVSEGVDHSLLVFIAVGTPEGEDGSADLQYVLAVARDVGRVMNSYKIIVNKSTVPVGTAELVREAVSEELESRDLSLEFDVISNPEFLKEGNAVQDFLKPDRVIVGCDNVRTTELLKELYSPFLRTNHPIVTMDVRSAEMTKYASNAMLATKISFINEMANICERVGADIGSVRLGMGADSRIGYQFLFPGVGYGGSCFPKDVRAIIQTAQAAGYDPELMRSVDEVNERQKPVLAQKILRRFEDMGRDPATTVVAIWGLSFKPNTDDIREASSLVNIKVLLEAGVKVRLHDPIAIDKVKRLLGEQEGITYCPSNYEALEGAHSLAICTEWGAYRRPDFDRLKELMEDPVIFDGRNIYEPENMVKKGITYFGIGRLGIPQ